MTATAHATAQPRRFRGTLAILAGLIAGAALSLGVDQVLHTLQVYPPWGQPMYEPSDNLLALTYRCVFSVLASYIAARLAPRNPMRHALALGWINFAVSTIGAIVTVTSMDLGPAWYPIGLAISCLPCAWLGGLLHSRRHDKRASVTTSLAAAR